MKHPSQKTRIGTAKAIGDPNTTHEQIVEITKGSSSHLCNLRNLWMSIMNLEQDSSTDYADYTDENGALK